MFSVQPQPVLTFMWFKGGVNLISDTAEIVVPRGDGDSIRNSLQGQLLPWSFYFCLLCWISSMASLDEGQTRTYHRWISGFSPNHFWCWEFHDECNRLDYWEVLRELRGKLCYIPVLVWSPLPTARCVSAYLKTSYHLASGRCLFAPLWRRWQPFLHWAVPASCASQPAIFFCRLSCSGCCCHFRAELEERSAEVSRNGLAQVLWLSCKVLMPQWCGSGSA